MKFTLSWLKEHLATKKTLDEILDLMVQIGLEVEEVDDPAARLAPFTVCKVLEAEQHPDADKLRVCKVETVDGIKQIVCGAPNARAGMTAVYAPLGAYIPGLDFALDKKPRKIRGVESHGMMCSAKELEAGEDHDGIADLDDSFELGTPASVALDANDPVIDFEVTPNRPDWLGVSGIARDLAAAGAGRHISPDLKSFSGSFDCPVDVRTDDESACAIFTGVYIRNVVDGPSPDWMQKQLLAVGIQPKSLLVDVTNYVSIDRARPLHSYDADKLNGVVHARLGKPDESFEALDGKTYKVTEDMCVIADNSGVIGLGGVMGGQSTAVSETTVNVFLEAAWFDPLRTARAGRTTGIISDARYRFERGVDMHSCMDGLKQAVALIKKYGGGKVSKPVSAGAAMVHADKVTFNPEDVERLTGLSVKLSDMKRMLKDLGFKIEDAGEAWYLTVPSWRFDISQSADFVEEIARLIGFDQLPQASLPTLDGLNARPTSLQWRVRTGRRVMASRGFIEAVTWSFMSEPHAALFGGDVPALRVANPVASELSQMRPSILGNLARAAQRSADHGTANVHLFEAGPIYLGDGPKDQRTVISGLVQPSEQRHWGAQKPSYDAQAAKADLYALLESFGQPPARFQIAEPKQDYWHPGRSARLTLGPKTTIAHFGALHPRVLKALGVNGPAFGFELNLQALPNMKTSLLKTKPVLSKADLTPIRRDFAFVVDQDVPAGEIIRLAKKAHKTLISGVSVFDVYQGAGIEDGQKSVAIEVTLQPSGEAMKEADISALSDAIISAITKGTKGVLRA
ncbi:MAG: phenylalanine--tRNA ligase subunit beta [Hyphomonadaceae bacterium]